MSRELLYCWALYSLDVLIPKQRGEGFLKVPWGHHADAELSRIEDSIPGCKEVCGLDGYLCFDVGYTGDPSDDSRRDKIVEVAMPQLAKRFRCDGWRKITREEFFKVLLP